MSKRVVLALVLCAGRVAAAGVARVRREGRGAGASAARPRARRARAAGGAARRRSGAEPTAHKVEVNLSELRVERPGRAQARRRQRAGGRAPGRRRCPSSRPRSRARRAARIALHGARLAAVRDRGAGAQHGAQRRHPSAQRSRCASRAARPSTGWLTLNGLQMTPRTDDEVRDLRASTRATWDDFAAQWQAMYDACRGSKTGNCPFVPGSIAKGGQLKTVLYAAGSGREPELLPRRPHARAARGRRRSAQAAKLAEQERRRRSRAASRRPTSRRSWPKAIRRREALFQFRAREAIDAAVGADRGDAARCAAAERVWRGGFGREQHADGRAWCR